MPFSSATSTCTQSPEQAMMRRILTCCGSVRGVPSLLRTRRSMTSADCSLGACFSVLRNSPAVSMLPATQPRPL